MHGVDPQKDLEKQENVKREYVDEVKKTQKLVEIDESSDILGAVIVLENKDENRESSGH